MTDEEQISPNPFGADYIKQENNKSFWLPEKEGDKISGKIVDIIDGEFGKTYSIEQENKEIINTPSHKVLQNRLVGAEIGDVIGVVYMGEELPKVKGQNPLKMYDIFIKNVK